MCYENLERPNRRLNIVRISNSSWNIRDFIKHLGALGYHKQAGLVQEVNFPNDNGSKGG
jgi:hypothetical protein